MPFRVSFFMVQQSYKLFGWSQNFWSGKTAGSDMTDAATELRTALNNLTGIQVACPNVRISTADAFRQVQLLKYNLGILAPTPTIVAQDADVPSTALLLQCKSGSGAYTRQWLRGIEDRQISGSGNYNPVGPFVGFFGALQVVLKTGLGNWSIRVLDPAVLPVDIVAFDFATGIFTAPNAAFLTGDKVRVKGAKNYKAINRIWKITKLVPTDTYQLQQWSPVTGFTALGGHPTARKQSYVYQQITDVKIVSASSHKTGRPFGLAGGRRKARAS